MPEKALQEVAPAKGMTLVIDKSRRAHLEGLPAGTVTERRFCSARIETSTSAERCNA